ncbi:MAG: hypothetical protein IJB96_08155 [Lachnospira sp.]|nr:hypothetical protein [Lachnospira sp.]
MEICRIVALVYVCHAVSAILHELGHWLAAKKLYGQYEEVRIGNFFCISIGRKFRISPIILNGYVSVNQEVVLDSSKRNVVVFFGAGLLVNLILIIAALSLTICNSAFVYLVWVNIVHIVAGILPVEGTDGYNMIRILSHKSKYDEVDVH